MYRIRKDVEDDDWMKFWRDVVREGRRVRGSDTDIDIEDGEVEVEVAELGWELELVMSNYLGRGVEALTEDYGMSR